MSIFCLNSVHTLSPPICFSIFCWKWVMALALDGNNTGALASGIRISDLRFADDISLLAENSNDLQQVTE